MLRVAVAKYHKGGWCERNVLSHSSRGWKPKIKVLTGFPLRVLRGDLFHPFSWLPVFSYQSLVFLSLYKGFPGSSNGKESALNAGDPGSIPWSGRSPLEGNGYPLQSSCLENSMDRGAWRGYSPWGRTISISTFIFTWCLPCTPVCVHISPSYKDTSPIEWGSSDAGMLSP